MKLLLIRHGQGEHTLDLPASLQRQHPRLTARGRDQTEALRDQLQVTERDVVIASPTPRALETATILCGSVAARCWASPVVGPRMFPQNPGYQVLPCDQLLDAATVRRDYPGWKLLHEQLSRLWTAGINTIAADRFQSLGGRLIQWCRDEGAERALFVCHDGTINNYRVLLGETAVTRADFLGEAGWIAYRERGSDAADVGSGWERLV